MQNRMSVTEGHSMRDVVFCLVNGKKWNIGCNINILLYLWIELCLSELVPKHSVVIKLRQQSWKESMFICHPFKQCFKCSQKKNNSQKMLHWKKMKSYVHVFQNLFFIFGTTTFWETQNNGKYPFYYDCLFFPRANQAHLVYSQF